MTTNIVVDACKHTLEKTAFMCWANIPRVIPREEEIVVSEANWG